MNNQLWMNQGDGSFIDEAVIAGVAVDANGEPKSGMGTDIADVNNDGLLDIWLLICMAKQILCFSMRADGFEMERRKVGYQLSQDLLQGLGLAFEILITMGILISTWQMEKCECQMWLKMEIHMQSVTSL